MDVKERVAELKEILRCAEESTQPTFTYTEVTLGRTTAENRLIEKTYNRDVAINRIRDLLVFYKSTEQRYQDILTRIETFEKITTPVG